MSIPHRIIVEILATPKLKDPSLICGLPGSGCVGKLAVDHLIEELRGIPFAGIFSSSFPPQVLIKSDGTADLMKNVHYYCKGKSRDLILLGGDAQTATPERESEWQDEINKIW